MWPRFHSVALYVALAVLIFTATITEGRTSHRARWELRSKAAVTKASNAINREDAVGGGRAVEASKKPITWVRKYRATDRTSDPELLFKTVKIQESGSAARLRAGSSKSGHAKRAVDRLPRPHRRHAALRRPNQHDSASPKQHARSLLGSYESQGAAVDVAEETGPPAPPPAPKCGQALACQPGQEWSAADCKCAALASAAGGNETSITNSSAAASQAPTSLGAAGQAPTPVPYEEVTPVEDFGDAEFAMIVVGISVAAIFLCIGAYFLYRKLKLMLADMDNLPDFATSAEMPHTASKPKGRGYPKYVESPTHFTAKMNPIWNSPSLGTDDGCSPGSKSSQDEDASTASSLSLTKDEDSSRMRSPRRQARKGNTGEWPGTSTAGSSDMRVQSDHWATL